MKVTLEFDNIQEAQYAIDSYSWYSTVWNLDMWLRNQIKYQDKFDLQPVRDALHTEIADQGLTLND